MVVYGAMGFYVWISYGLRVRREWNGQVGMRMKMRRGTKMKMEMRNLNIPCSRKDDCDT